MPTYTFVGMVNGRTIGYQEDATLEDIQALMECSCDEGPERCSTTAFMKDLVELGVAVDMATFEGDTSIAVAHINEEPMEDHVHTYNCETCSDRFIAENTTI